ncbi:MAG TPA: hypothetical protein VJ873_03800, partial [bacterium]|nr:hypothetical protein [bacterium]
VRCKEGGAGQDRRGANPPRPRGEGLTVRYGIPAIAAAPYWPLNPRPSPGKPRFIAGFGWHPVCLWGY